VTCDQCLPEIWGDLNCIHCEGIKMLKDDYKDAAEFEARVAIRAAHYARMAGASCMENWTLADIIKVARLAVEEDLNAKSSES